jgi:acyl-CoA hydrolase
MTEDQTQHKSLTMTVLATPDMVNFAGNVHGGATLELLEQVAYACASRYSGCYVITISVDQVTFLQRIHVGELMTFIASVNYTGVTSLEVGVRVIAENIRERASRHVMTCYFTMVTVNEDGTPTKVPTITVQTPDEKRRWDAAALRRELQKEIEQRSLEIRQNPESLTSEAGGKELSPPTIEGDTPPPPPQHKSLVMTVLATPDTVSFSGNVSAGWILDLLDQVAYACASRYSGCYVLTVSVDHVVFMQRIRVGELVTFHASVNSTGRTSMEVGIRVVAENIRERTSRHVMTCYFTMVAVDDQSKPTPVPPLVVETATEQRRWAAAGVRREFRKEVDRRMQEIRQNPELAASAESEEGGAT